MDDGETLSALHSIFEGIEKIFIPKLDDVIDSIYDDYEIFNFDISVFSNMINHLEKDIKNLDPVNTLAARVDFLLLVLKDMLEPAQHSDMLRTLITPFIVYL